MGIKTGEEFIKSKIREEEPFVGDLRNMSRLRGSQLGREISGRVTTAWYRGQAKGYIEGYEDAKSGKIPKYYE